MKTSYLFLGLSSFLVTPLLACSADPAGPDAGSGASSSGGSSGIGTIPIGSGANGPGPDSPGPATCANGMRDAGEACDDGNKENGDGCWGNCLGLDKGYVCPTPGELCRQYAKCGDGNVTFPEQCDDGNATGADGCSATCKIELGFKCEGTTCSPTTCGDGKVEGAEMCEPSLTPDGGCTAQCQFAPSCPAGGGACTSRCGDGLVLGEECDDGNNQNGDGCDSKCKSEPGYNCAVAEGSCTKAADGTTCILPVPTTFRDFSTAHSDFEEGSCAGTSVTSGLVQTTLNASGKPVATGSLLCTGKLSEWYTDTASSTRFNSEIVLYDDGQGNFVNRWGADGKRWHTDEGGGRTAGDYDGNPFFFPVDGIPGAKDDGGIFAQISTTEYGMTGALVNDPSGKARNFSFTSEVEYWFAYDKDTNATLKFVGDDDVWVFVNGKLALDLGGTHQALPGQFTISGGSTKITGGTGADHGMTTGNVYQIKVFHAERKSTGSSFKLTLTGFNARRSDCSAVCGDGILGAGEQCDDGKNDGGYNECQAGCVLGGYCGDGIKDMNEDCDDADPATPNCRGCHNDVIK